MPSRASLLRAFVGAFKPTQAADQPELTRDASSIPVNPGSSAAMLGNATCDVELLGAENFAFVLTDGGRRIHFISVTPSAVIHGEAQKQ